MYSRCIRPLSTRSRSSSDPDQRQAAALGVDSRAARRRPAGVPVPQGSARPQTDKPRPCSDGLMARGRFPPAFQHSEVELIEMSASGHPRARLAVTFRAVPRLKAQFDPSHTAALCRRTEELPAKPAQISQSCDTRGRKPQQLGRCEGAQRGVERVLLAIASARAVSSPARDSKSPGCRAADRISPISSKSSSCRPPRRQSRRPDPQA